MNDKHKPKDKPKKVSPELAQYLAQSVLSTLHPDVREALEAFSPEELKKLAALGEALRRHGGCEPDPCLRTVYAVH